MAMARPFLLRSKAPPLGPTTFPPMDRWARTELDNCFWLAHVVSPYAGLCPCAHSRLSVCVELPVVGLLAGAAKPEAQAVRAQVKGGGGGGPAHAAQPLVCDSNLMVVGAERRNRRRSERRGRAKRMGYQARKGIFGLEAVRVQVGAEDRGQTAKCEASLVYRTPSPSRLHGIRVRSPGPIFPMPPPHLVVYLPLVLLCPAVPEKTLTPGPTSPGSPYPCMAPVPPGHPALPSFHLVAYLANGQSNAHLHIHTTHLAR